MVKRGRHSSRAAKKAKKISKGKVRKIRKSRATHVKYKITPQRIRERIRVSGNLEVPRPVSPVVEKTLTTVFAFLIVVLLIALIRQPMKPVNSSLNLMTGKVILVSEPQPTFALNDTLKGLVKLQLQQGDLLPMNSTLQILITHNETNATYCPSYYICLDDPSKKVPWMRYNETTGECEVIETDPESACCLRAGEKCRQRIADSGFESSGKLGVFRHCWISLTRGVRSSAIRLNQELQPVGYYQYKPNFYAITSATQIDLTKDEGNATIKQALAQRKIKISDLKFMGEKKVEKGLVGYWSFENVEGDIVKDDSGNGNKGQFFGNNFILKEGKIGKAFFLDGCKGTSDTAERIWIADNDMLDTDYQFTLAAWIYPRNYTSGHTYYKPGFIISKWYNSTSVGDYLLGIEPEKKIRFTVAMGEEDTFKRADIQSESTIPLNQWTHVAVTFNRGRVRIYINGKLDKEAEARASDGTLIDHTTLAEYDNPNPNCGGKCDGIFIGNLWNAYHYNFNGSIDEVYIYNRALSEQEIKALSKAGTFRWKVRVSPYETFGERCAFEFVVKAKHGTQERSLHYYYELSNFYKCLMPFDTETDKYIKMNASDVVSENFIEVERDIYNDWLSKFSDGADDEIIAIYLVSHGAKEEGPPYEAPVYGQSVHWDDIELVKPGLPEPNKSCESYGLKCCLNGTGIKDYYGLQLDCKEGYECWSSCTQSWDLKLPFFIASSESPESFNISYGQYNCQGEGCEELYYCYEFGSGYAPCSDTSENAPENCRGWDNTYVLNLSKLLPPPIPFDYSGDFNLKVRLSFYSPNCEKEVVILEDEKPFTISGLPQPPITPPTVCTPNWINCTNITKCDASTDYKEVIMVSCVDANNCGIECPPEICKIVGYTNETCEPFVPLRACTASDYEEQGWCTEWSEWPKWPCSPEDKQTRVCEAPADQEICNATAPEAYTPETERECDLNVIKSYIEEQKSEGKSSKAVKKVLVSAGWPETQAKTLVMEIYGEEEKEFPWLTIIAIAVAILAILLFLLLKKKPKAKPTKPAKEVPTELLSYIKDALAAGATKAEIAARLVEAGWPRETIDTAMRSLK